MCGCNEGMFQEIAVFGPHAYHPNAAAILSAVG